MEKMVGNFLNRVAIFLLLAVSNYMCASDSAIVLSIQDMNYKPISQAMCQAPFILQVELKNIESYTDIHLMQYITGIENFKSSRSMTSQNVSIDNGKKTVKIVYNFVLRADKKGKFTVGPLSLNDKHGQSVRSNRLIIPVGDEVLASDKNQKDKYFMKMSLSKKQVYVGEKITLHIKFYDRLFVDDLHLKFPDFENLYIVKNKNKINKNMELIEEEEYSVTEWVFDMYATKPGQLIIQDIQAAFFAPELESKFKFGGSFDFFRSLHKSQRCVVAQPIKIDVKPLPEHKEFHNILTVGQISKFTASINQNSVSDGQGIVLTTELFGNVNFEIMDALSLKLPEGFKYYDSNMVTINETRTKKHCEFIVQASNPGTYDIQPQSLVYFDPIDEQYKTIESNDLGVITVTESNQSPQTSQLSDNVLEDVCLDGQCPAKELQDFYVLEKGSIHTKVDRAISPQRFQHLIGLLFLIWFFMACYRSLFKKYILQHPVLHHYIIFAQAVKSYNLALQKNQISALHKIFIHLFTQLIKNHVGQLDRSVIVAYLIDKDFSDEQIQSWKRFYEAILQVSFSSTAHIQQEILWEQALEWIQLLKEKA